MQKTGLYFVGEAIADQRQDPDNPRKMIIALGGSSYFGSTGAAQAIKNLNLGNIDSFYLGSMSDDCFGNLIKDDFRRYGVKTDYIRQSPFISMIAVVSEDGLGGNKYSFYGRNQPNTTEHLKLEDLPISFNEQKRIFIFGSVATTLSPSSETIRQFIKSQPKEVSLAIFDPNTRPSVITDLQKYRSILEECVKVASIIKASEEDIRFTYPELSSQQVATHWISQGARAVFITKGIKGCDVFCGDQHACQETTTNSAITRTVGAGDNFNAGIALALANRNLMNLSQLEALDIDDWKKIAAFANQTSYNHLLRTNNLTNNLDK